MKDNIASIGLYVSFLAFWTFVINLLCITTYICLLAIYGMQMLSKLLLGGIRTDTIADDWLSKFPRL